MSTNSYDSKAQRLVPFTLQGRRGRVAVYYGPNDDAVKAGFDAVPGIDFPIDLCLGYPVMQAQIESYAGSGYRTLCGWIQIITREWYAKADTERTGLKRSCSIDLAPSMYGTGVPWTCFGSLPSLFDAPCLNLGDNAELTWIADTFLTTIPLRSRDEKIRWLLGFRWGYREYDACAEKPVELLPLEITDAQVWNRHLPFLCKEFDVWRFEQV
jgi:hypothetical protein